MRILLVNDDGIHAPGLRAMRNALQQLGDVQVVAPLVEQSGVGHRITYLHPILTREIMEDGQHYGWAVDGSPADCTKMGVLEYCKEPDLIVSGINSGANVGINVLYSGTVAAAIEGAFFGITSIAVSLAQGTPPDYPTTAARAVNLIKQLLEQKNSKQGMLWNINFPDTQPDGPQGVKFVSMEVRRHTDTVLKREDPRGRPYYWSGLDPLNNHELSAGTDVKELRDGFVTVTPLHFDLTETQVLQQQQGLDLSFDE